MTTKEQERQAIEKIRKIVEGLGENSYVGFAMEGVLELAEDNIREDTAYSMKKNAEIAWERADKAEKEILSCGNTGNHEKDCCRWSDKKRMGWPCVHMRKAGRCSEVRGNQRTR